MAWLIWWPLAAAALLFVIGGAARRWVGLAASVVPLVPAARLLHDVLRTGPRRAELGWPQPLGIELQADALSAALILLTCIVGCVVSGYAFSAFGAHDVATPWDEAAAFWPLWLMAWAAMHALYLSTDVFNVYVALELLTLAAVALVALPGTRATIAAALQYLLATLVGSLSFLFGVALLYAAYGRLELFELGSRIEPGPLALTALGLMTLGVMLKGALFPLHVWLPDAHGHALPPVSAVLSGLVVKAGFYLLVRLWFDTFSTVLHPWFATALGLAAVVGIVWASVLALGQTHLKRLLAYSTVAQLALMLLLFPLVMAGSVPLDGEAASRLPGWGGGVVLALSHGLAKAGLFLAAGASIRAAGTDALRDLAGTARRLPLTAGALVLGAWTLLGLPPSGGYVAKSLFEEAAIGAAAPWAWGVQGATVLTALYLGVALRSAFTRAPEGRSFRAVPLPMQLAPLVLTGVAAGLGLLLSGLGEGAP
jgi:multicomponent Na+:H+ antiporter subunit D